MELNNCCKEYFKIMKPISEDFISSKSWQDGPFIEERACKCNQRFMVVFSEKEIVAQRLEHGRLVGEKYKVKSRGVNL